jgi:hypothetical protein
LKPRLFANPELDRIGNQPVAGPPLRPRRRAVGIERVQATHLVEQLDAALKRPALARRKRSDAARTRTRGPVFVGLALRDFFDAPFDARLLAGEVPVDGECGAPVLRQLASLAALAVGVEHEAVRRARP